MNDLLYEDLDNLIKDIINDKDFLRYKELKNIIFEKYYLKISKFNIAKDEYKASGAMDIEYREKCKANLASIKEELYSLDEVKEYKKLENSIANKLTDISNSISKCYSNKFKTKKIIEV